MDAVIVLVGIVVLLVAIDLFHRARTRRLRESGELPPPGQGTDADVTRLIMSGRKVTAIQLYREIHGGDLRSAKEAVETIAGRLNERGRTDEQAK